MGCGCSKKKDINRKPTNYNNVPPRTKSDAARFQKAPDTDVWKEIEPLKAPYPQGDVNIEDILNPNDLRQDTLENPANEMFSEERVGKWVEVQAK